MAQTSKGGMPQLELNKVLPLAIVGVILLGFAAAVVGNWVMDMMDSSYRTVGRYAKQLEVPMPGPVNPKDSYLCRKGEKNPWIGCMIQ